MEIAETRTDRLMRAALSGLSARQRAIADNVANVDTPGFKASRVTFEQALRRAMGEERGLAMTPVANSVVPAPEDPSELAPGVTQLESFTLRADGNNVDVDQQMLELTETNLTYNAVTQLMSSRLQLLRTVINDGRR